MDKILGDDGEVRFTDFMKFATPTELCKIDHTRGGSVIAAKEEEEKKKKESKKGKVSFSWGEMCVCVRGKKCPQYIYVDLLSRMKAAP